MQERDYLRDLARRYVDICQDSAQDQRRQLRRRHNSLQATRPPIYIRAFAWHEMSESQPQCQDPLYRHYEDFSGAICSGTVSTMTRSSSRG